MNPALYALCLVLLLCGCAEANAIAEKIRDELDFKPLVPSK
jgi:hypothetical protein